MRSTFTRLVKLSLPYWRWMSLSVFLGAGTIGSSIGLLATSAYIIAMAALQPSIAELQLAIVGVRFFGIARGALRYLERITSHQTTFILLARIRVWFYARLEPLAPARLLDFQTGDLLARIVSDIETLQQFFLRVLAPPIVALIVACLASLFVARYYPLLGWILILGLFLAGALLPASMQFLHRGIGKHLVLERGKLQMSLTETIQGIVDLLAHNSDQTQMNRVITFDSTYRSLQRRLASYRALGDAISGLIIHVTVAVVMLVVIPLVNSNRLSGIDLTVLLLTVIASFEAIQPLPGVFHNLEKHLAAGKRLFEVIDLPRAGEGPIEPTEQPVTFELQIENLHFKYRDDGPYVIEDLNLHLPEGECIALVGASGAGKSTLVNLLLRFWDPDEGRIFLGGKDLQRYRASDVRSWMAVLSQDTQIFNGTIRENLFLARPGAKEDEMVQASERAQFHDFVLSLPKEYETWVGEGGALLSGGERQRLALTRVLLKDAPILILDEPSTNVDPLTELKLLESLQDIMRERTTILISHRLVAMELASEVLVLDAGRVIERGNHTHLLRADGYYRRMWDLQMQAEVVENISHRNL